MKPGAQSWWRTAATIGALCLAPSCAWNSKWTFAVTQKCYDGIARDGPSYPAQGWDYSGGKQEAAVLGVFILGIIVLPIAVDVACLPVAWVHDQVFCN